MSRGRSTAIAAPRALLVPVDLSPRSREGLFYAMALARQLEAVVVVMINLNRPEVAYLEDQRPGWGGTMRELAEIELARWVGDDVSDVPIRFVATEHLEAAEGILAATVQTDVDAIVMGSHGRSTASRWILGSVTERVVRDAPVPVFVVPSHLEVPEAVDASS